MSKTSRTNTTKPAITLGGKGSTLSSTALFNISNSLSLLCIDSSAKISPNSNNAKHFPQLPDYLSLEESRASLVVILNKLLLTNSASHSVTQTLLDCINNATHILDTCDGNVNGVFDAAVQGVCGLLDRRCAGLCAVADAVVAMSCEATRADVGVVNLLSDSGDGNSDKDEVGVASDLRVFLNGSKLIGKEKVDVVTGFVNRVPEIHGGLRCVLRTLHAKTRVGLNSGRSGSGNVVFVSSLAKVLVGLGEASWGRVGWVVGSMMNENARFVEMFEEGCPKVERLKELYGSFQCADNDGEYLKAVHEVYCLADVVRTILSWEAAAAFVWLSLLVEGGADLFGQGNNVGEVEVANGKGNDDVKGNDKRLQKEKKKNKVVMGKGTTALVQFLKDRVLVTSAGDLEKVVKQILSFLDPKDPGFEEVVDKIKDIVDSNESRRLPKLPKGTRDFAKEQMAIREKAFSIIGDVFKRHGAMALDTPAFEMKETLMGKYGEDSKLIYDLADQGGELCSLRYDLTVPFARYVAMNGLTSFKRYQIAKVYRRDNPSKGRYREFYQCDFDIAGQFETMGPDFEVIKILTELLDELNIGDYEIKLNHRKLLDGMLDICGVPPEKFRTICSSIDKLDKQSFEQIKKEMVEEKGLNAETADKIGTFVKQRGHPLELLYELKQTGSKFLENSESVQSLNELEILFRALDKSKCIGKVVLDLSLARGLDYYTGVIYEAVFKGATQVGSIAAGGRYDKLIGMFGTKQVPAVGVSLGIERVFTIMEQLQKDQNQAVRATETQILVSILGDDLSLAAELVSECWAAKLKAEYLLNKRVMKHIDRAKDSRIPWMVIVGEREINEGTVKLKNVAANEEMEVPRSTFVEELQRRLNTFSS